MKAFRAAAVLVLLAGGPAYAQMQTPSLNLLADQPSKTPDQIEQEQARDKAYKESLKKIPDAKISSDPWGSVRSDAPKSAPAKTVSNAAAKPKSPTAAKGKTGTNTPN
jgi:hypothetical protein